jgi:hypothetical protein
MKKDVETWVAQCPVCQRSKHENCHYPGLLDPLPVPDMAWTHVSMDFVEGLPKSQGKEVIMVVVDKFTKYAHFIPLSHPYTVETVAQAFMDGVVKLHGPPLLIISDRDRIFKTGPALVIQVRQIPRNNVAVVQWLVQWDNLSPEEATWEDADFIKESFPVFFKATVQSWQQQQAAP